MKDNGYFPKHKLYRKTLQLACWAVLFYLCCKRRYASPQSIALVQQLDLETLWNREK